MSVVKGRLLLLQVKDGANWLNFAGMQARSFVLNNQEIESTISPASVTDALWGTALGGIKQMSLAGTIRTVNEKAERLLWNSAFSSDATVEMRVVLPPSEVGSDYIYGASFTGRYTITSFGMSGDLQTAASLEVAFTSNGPIAVSNPADTTPPTLVRGTVDGTAIVLTFSEALDTGSVPATSAFTVTGVAAGNALTGSAAISGATVSLTLSNAAVAGDGNVRVAYAKPSNNPLQDAAGNDVETFAATAIQNNT